MTTFNILGQDIKNIRCNVFTVIKTQFNNFIIGRWDIQYSENPNGGTIPKFTSIHPSKTNSKLFTVNAKCRKIFMHSHLYTSPKNKILQPPTQYSD